MPPLPKKKHSKKRRGDKRAHKGITPVKTVKCIGKLSRQSAVDCKKKEYHDRLEESYSL